MVAMDTAPLQNKKILERVSFPQVLAVFRAKIMIATAVAIALFIGVVFLVRSFDDGTFGASMEGILATIVIVVLYYLVVVHASVRVLIAYYNIHRLQTTQLKQLKAEHENDIELLLIRDRQLSDINSRLMRSNQDLESSTKMLIKKDRDLVAANQKLIHIDELKSDFVTTVAHQLRTPLSGTKWILSMLSKGEFGPITEEERQYVLKAYDSNNRMIILVNELLDIDRLENDKIQYVFGETDLFAITDDVVVELSPSVGMRGITIKIEGRENPFKIVADGQKIRSVIQNLLDNATKYIPNAGEISIKIEKDEKQAKFTIKDSGIGIPSRAHEKIFTLFYRAPNATQTETDGSGAGLYLSKKIIKKHGGDMWFESEEGKGTTFYFTIPFGLKANSKER